MFSKDISSIWMNILLYYSIKAVVRPHVEFANTVWCPFKLDDIKFKEVGKNLKEGHKTHN